MASIEKDLLSDFANVRTGCICRNHGRPVDGKIFIDPCCKVHYAELDTSALIASSIKEITEAERTEWLKRESIKKRVRYPKMAVAKR